MCKLTAVKSALNQSIGNVVENKELFVRNKEKDFIRTSKLTFEEMIRIILQAGGQTINKELSAYFSYEASMPTPSAFCQKRSKITFEAFRYLFSDFTKSCSVPKVLKGYRLLAVDGSQVYIPRNESDTETFIYNGEDKNGWNRLHINALYDLLNHIYADAVITPGKKTEERGALIQMLENLKKDDSFIIIADRGYESYELIHYLLTNNIRFVFRVKEPESNGPTLGKAVLPEKEEFDIPFTLKIASQNSYKGASTKEQIEQQGYKITKPQYFSLLSKEQPTYTFDTFRVIKLQLLNGKKEYLITSLPAEIFSKEDVKKIYGMRWGIETSFRELKYDFSVMQFHSKKVEHIKQEIFAKLTMYNFCRMITESLEEHVNPGKKYAHKINFSQAVLYCKGFFLGLIEPPLLKELILRATSPIRPDRFFERRVIKKQHKSFQYRIA